MAVYSEIITWSNNKAAFIKDALRRLIQSPTLTVTDIDDLTNLVKKEVGFTGVTQVAVPITATHIPSTFSNINDVASLISIENPININSLYHKAKLEFEKTGLTVVYGNNGSGKSSYSKILKKTCWSRHKDFQLKTNVHTNDKTPQSVTVNYQFSNAANAYLWNNNQPIDPHLNTVFIFDSDCADIYLNAENVTEYKPLGIDLLERLIQTFSLIEVKILAEKRALITQKPTLNPVKLGNTLIYNWYQRIETINVSQVQNRILFTQTDINRKSELISLLVNINPTKQKILLEQKRLRLQTLITEIRANLKLFTPVASASITEIKEEYNTKYGAYLVAQQNLNGNFTLNGVGSESWRLLWEAAKNFAITEIHPDEVHFPSGKSEDFCVLCQQKIDGESKERLQRFNLFVSDKTSSEFDVSKQKVHQLITGIQKLVLTANTTVEELDADIPTFKNSHTHLITELEEAKRLVIDYLQSDTANSFPRITNSVDVISIIQIEITKIDYSILSLNTLTSNRTLLENELLELEGLEFLTSNLTQILNYHQENTTKIYLDKCLANLNTAAISRKIGELLESEAITLQQQEFLAHLTTLNKEIAGKVSITKARTASGKTYQKTGFNSINEKINLILSEGELKVVALANFLSECTIDNRINSIIFDDPVTSLDQNYREAIANILVALSANRQVVVLTHDLYFLRLLLEANNKKFNTDCKILGLTQRQGICGYASDEIPYLARNTQQRIDSIRAGLVQIGSLPSINQDQIDMLLDSARKRFRMLIEKAVEELLANRSIERFSKNIHVKGGNLSSFVVVEHNDIQLLLSLFAKYSITEHDGSESTLPQLPDEHVIETDLGNFSAWKNDFNTRLRNFKTANGY